MSFFYPVPNQVITDALATGDWDTAAAYMDDQTRSLEDFTAGQQHVTVTGATDGAGALTIAHKLDLTHRSVLTVQGWWWDDATSRQKPLTVTYVDATNVVLTGGGATKQALVTLVVSAGLITFF